MLRMNQLTPVETEVEDREVFDFSSPEDVLIYVLSDDNRHGYGEWKDHLVDLCTVIKGAEGVIGAASYDEIYGGFLNYTIEGLIDCPGEGWWVVENVTGEYTKGDGWMTDDNMDFYCGAVRPATEEEIKLA